MLTYAFEPRPFIFDIIKHLQEQDDYEVIALEGYTPQEQAQGIEMIDKTDSSIPEFIDLFANADVVVTSSFHGTAFAVNFGIPLVSVVPEGKNDDRQSTLLKSITLDFCIASSSTKVTDINPVYNKQKAMSALNRLRSKSITWIQENIK